METRTDEVGGRLAFLDVLRGFDMLFIMGLAGLVVKLCAAFGGCAWLAGQMEHPEWMGLTHHDTIFPLFIFIAGVAFPFSCAKQLACGRTKMRIAVRVLRRAVVLFLLGMVYERYFGGVPFRFGSVLGRIGIAWAAGALLYLACGARTRIAVAAALILGYWALNLFVAAPDNPSAGVWTPQGNVVCWFDRTFIRPLGRISPGTAELPFDNQTFLSNAMAAVTAMLGVFTGEFVRKTRGTMSGDRRVAILFAAAAVLAGLSVLVAFGCGAWSFPFSKILWSPSFVLAVGAYSVGMFALFHWLVDVRGLWTRTLFFRVIGLNSITIYLAQPLLGLGGLNARLFGRLSALVPEPWSGVVLGACYILTCWLLLYFLYRRKIFLKV